MSVRLHQGAKEAAAQAIRLERYLSYSVSDEELVERVIQTYNEAKPNRSRRPAHEAHPHPVN